MTQSHLANDEKRLLNDSLSEAHKNKNIKKVHEIISQCSDPIYALHNSVYWASDAGNIEYLKEAFSSNKINVSWKNDHGYGWSFLHTCTLNGHIDVCSFLISKGANINQVDERGDTPIHRAAYYGRNDVVKVLIEGGANLYIENNDGHTPIDEAKKGNRQNCVHILQTAMSRQQEHIISTEVQGDVVEKSKKLNQTVQATDIDMDSDQHGLEDDMKQKLEQYRKRTEALELQLMEQMNKSDQHQTEKNGLVEKLKERSEQHERETKELMLELEENTSKSDQHVIEKKGLEDELKKKSEQYEREKDVLELQLEERLEEHKTNSKRLAEELKKRTDEHERVKEGLVLQLEGQKKESEQHEIHKQKLVEELKERSEQLEREKEEFESKLQTHKRRSEQFENELQLRLTEEKKRVENEKASKERLKHKLAVLREEYETHLSINDLCAVLEVTADAKEQWEELGRLLGIDSNKLSKISRDHSSILLRYSEMMKYWIKQVGASWKNLVHALESPLMNEIAVAQKITNKYLGNEGKSSCVRMHIVTNIEKPLTEYDLSGAVNATSTIQDGSWKVLGLILGMSDDNLEIIQNSQSSPDECLHDVLAYWIKTGKAYWSVLVDSLSSSLLQEYEVAEEISRRYLKTEATDQPKTSEEAPDGVHIFPVGEEDLKEMKQRIGNLFKARPECQGIAFVIGIHGPAGTGVDIDNVRNTFIDLKFAVWDERDLTCSKLACLVKAAASHMYPGYKYLAFYFAGHGGSVNGHPFVIPMKLKGDGSQQKLFIEQSILSCFQKSRKRCLFFFDCCLVATEDSDKSTQASNIFKLTAPVKCLVAYATATGYKSQGDKVQGGLWTRTLCAKLKEPLPLSAILDETHTIVTSTTNEQPPHYESCLGSVNLKGISEECYQQYNESVAKLSPQYKVGINGITSPDQDEVDSQLHIESHSPIEERLQELIQEIRLTKEQLEQMTSMKHDQLQQARSMKQDQEEIKRYIKWQVMILFPIAFIFIFKYLTKH